MVRNTNTQMAKASSTHRKKAIVSDDIKKGRKKPIESDEDSEQETVPKKIRKAPTKKKIVESESESEQEPPPKKTRKAPAKKKIVESESEEEAPKKGRRKKTKKEISETSEESEDELPARTTRGRPGKKIPIKAEKRKKGKPSSHDRCLEFRTPQTGVIKQVFERVGNVASDCTLIFSRPETNEVEEDDEYCEEIDNRKRKKTSRTKPKIENRRNTGGLRLVRLTEDGSVLVKMSLKASNFEHFYCEDANIFAGIDLNNFNSYLKTIDDDDPITMYMLRENHSKLFICTGSITGAGREETEIEIDLMEIEKNEIDPPAKNFENMITIGSDKLHNNCKKINNTNSAVVEITAVGSSINFRGHNEGGRMLKKYQDTSQPASKKSDKVIHGVYELRNLLAFSKCNKLCDTVDIYLLEDYPLVLIFAVGTLGKMYVFMTPIGEQTN